MSRRVFLLGLDGASWNVLDRLLAAGAMPNLARLCREGVRATLESTIPPVTPVAWLSLQTGCNPGRHGVFGFLKPSPGNSYLPVPVNRTDARVPTIFDYYREGGPLVSLNLPMSWPATPMNGAMVTCMMTPLRDMRDFEHPGGLLARLARAGIDYVIDPKFKARRGDDGDAMFADWRAEAAPFVAMLTDIARARFDAVRLLMAEEPWDCFVCVEVGTDRLQHLFWERLMPEDGDGPAPELAAYYRYVDERLGELAAALDPADALLIVSDHGFTGTRGRFRANEWLRERGWLARREARRSPLYPLKRALNAVGITRQGLIRVVGEKQTSRLQLAASHVDWDRTDAFLDNPFGIRINLRGRETRGRVPPERFDRLCEEIAAALREAADPDGEPAFTDVHRRDEVYAGDAREHASDIVFASRDDRCWSAYGGEVGAPLFEATPFKTGDHRRDGVFVAWGGGVRRPAGGAEPRFSIQDVLPTLLHLNGRAVPAVCDGRVLAEILADSAPVRVDDDWRRFLPRGGRAALGADQADEVAERLRELGYLSDG